MPQWRVASCLKWGCSIMWRGFATRHQERIRVNAGSQGFVTVDLHHVPRSGTDALVIHLPPDPMGTESSVRAIPEFLKEWPVASINYRWGGMPAEGPGPEEETAERLPWPIPAHDTAFAAQWIMENLMPEREGRGNIFVYGSHLGASLATSLALTESYPDAPFAVRGLAAYNGIYNWTMFLPDHRINHREETAPGQAAPARGAHISQLAGRLESLFDTPSNLFDPFASPSLFFHTPGMLIPHLFHMSAVDAALLGAVTGYDKLIIRAAKPPKASHLTFPPDHSALRIPETLLLHDSVPHHQLSGARSRQDRHLYTLRLQAAELAGLMRRSIVRNESADQSDWDYDGYRKAELHHRVQVVDVGEEGCDLELNRYGQQILLDLMRSIL